MTRSIFVAFLAFALTPHNAAADEPTEAERLYNDGQAAFDANRFDDAVTAWERSYELSKEPGLHFNLGQAYRQRGKPGDCAKARDAYKKFIELDASSEQRPAAEGFLADIQKCVARETATNTTKVIVLPTKAGAEPERGGFAFQVGWVATADGSVPGASELFGSGGWGGAIAAGPRWGLFTGELEYSYVALGDDRKVSGGLHRIGALASYALLRTCDHDFTGSGDGHGVVCAHLDLDVGAALRRAYWEPTGSATFARNGRELSVGVSAHLGWLYSLRYMLVTSNGIPEVACRGCSMTNPVAHALMFEAGISFGW